MVGSGDVSLCAPKQLHRPGDSLRAVSVQSCMTRSSRSVFSRTNYYLMVELGLGRSLEEHVPAGH